MDTRASRSSLWPSCSSSASSWWRREWAPTSKRVTSTLPWPSRSSSRCSTCATGNTGADNAPSLSRCPALTAQNREQAVPSSHCWLTVFDDEECLSKPKVPRGYRELGVCDTFSLLLPGLASHSRVGGAVVEVPVARSTHAGPDVTGPP